MTASWTLNKEPTGASQQPDPEQLRLGKIDCGGGTVVHGMAGRVLPVPAPPASGRGYF